MKENKYIHGLIMTVDPAKIDMSKQENLELCPICYEEHFDSTMVWSNTVKHYVCNLCWRHSDLLRKEREGVCAVYIEGFNNFLNQIQP